MGETKVCPHCQQEIPAASRKCHHCQEWVNRRRVLAWRFGWILPLFAVMIAMPWVMDRTMLREKKFWQHPDAIAVLSHHTAEDEKGARCVVGTIKNVSEIPWDSITVQVDYYNSAGELVDTSSDWSGDTLAPGAERSFKVVFEKKLRGADYDHYRVFVAGADDASRF